MKKFLVAASLVGVIMAMALPAQAFVNVAVAGPGASISGFETPVVVLSQAVPAYFLQADPIAPHDFTEKPVGASNSYQPKFYTERSAGAGLYEVMWRGNPAPGDYRFICTVHGNMVGTATVV